MVELHRNDKILIIAVLALIACFFLLRAVFYFLVGFAILAAIVIVPVYFLYKSITKKIANIGNNPVTTREKLHANVAQIKFRQAGQKRRQEARKEDDETSFT